MRKLKNEMLQMYMLRNGISQRELAEVLGVDPSRITAYMDVEMSERQQDEFIRELEEAINGKES